MNITDGIASATLLATIVGIAIAGIAYRNQIAMMEPWSLTKIEDGLWMLKKTSPKLATIYGITGGELGDVFQSTVLNPAVQPAKYFKNGTDILVKIESSSPRVPVFVCYQEHRKEVYPFSHSYRHLSLVDLDSLPAGVKVWSTYIY